MIQASRKQWIKFGIVLVLYLIFLIWLKSWLGLVVVPFIAGVIWFCVNTDSFGAKLLMGAGLVIIVASVIAATEFRFRYTSLYNYLIMLILMFGGAALVLKVLCHDPDKKRKKDD